MITWGVLDVLLELDSNSDTEKGVLDGLVAVGYPDPLLVPQTG